MAIAIWILLLVIMPSTIVSTAFLPIMRQRKKAKKKVEHDTEKWASELEWKKLI